jgi:hypothetical protein
VLFHNAPYTSLFRQHKRHNTWVNGGRIRSGAAHLPQTATPWSENCMVNPFAESFDSASRQLRPVIVAIPARDEAQRIGGCLAALDDQQQRPDTVVLLLNNCSDATEAIVRALEPRLQFRLDIVCQVLPAAQASAGHARRLAMQIAARLAAPAGVLLTTDADTIVPRSWVRHNLAALGKGVDAVCGRVAVDPTEAALIPEHLHQDDALEKVLIGLLDEVAWMLDPEPHDPPPRHTEASGASLAVSVAAYTRVGGIPDIRSGEDREFVASLWRADARIRHEPGIEVVVSGRTVGRAEGGMADAIRRRMVQQDEFADDQVEPAMDAWWRYSSRYRARCAWSAKRIDAGLASDLNIPVSVLAEALSRRFFGSAWAKLERVSPRLYRRRVRFADLRDEIARAQDVLRQLEPRETMAAE